MGFGYILGDNLIFYFSNIYKKWRNGVQDVEEQGCIGGLGEEGFFRGIGGGMCLLLGRVAVVKR